MIWSANLDGSNPATSVYDGLGHRVQTKQGGVTKTFFYDINGSVVAEYEVNAGVAILKKEYGYRNGQLLITAEAATSDVPRTNYALASNGSSATASSNFYNGTSFAPSPAGAIDGEHRGSNYSTTGAWHSSTNTVPQWWVVDFNTNRTIEEINVFSCQDNWSNPAEPTETMTFNSLGLTQFQVQYWNGGSWVDVPGGNVTGNNKVWRKFTFAPITTDKLRVYIHATGDNWSRIVEVEAWSPTSTPGGGGTSANINWLVTDQLGTPRIIIDKTGALANVKRHDYLPFGEELVAGQGLRTSGINGLGYNADTIRQKFTSKERDNETGLDYFLARYYSSIQGRFTSPDEFKGGAYEFWLLGDPSAGEKQALPFGDIRLPQSLNKYQYCYNNPLKFVDPNGHDALYIENKDTGKTTIVIPVHFTGPSATPGLISEVISRASQLDTGNPNVTIRLVATDKPMHGVLNTMNLSPDLDKKYPVGEGVEGRGGKKGHMRSNGVGSGGAIVHDLLHMAGLKDRYEERGKKNGKRSTTPAKGYDNSNIMTSNGGTKLNSTQIKEAKDNGSTKNCTTENGVTKCK